MLSCQGFLNNNEYIVILKCPNSMSQYYFNKGFIQLTCDEDNLKTLPVKVKDRVGAEVKVNSELFMLCYATITSTSNKLKNSIPKKAMSRLFSTYVTPQIKEIYHSSIIQEWKFF